MKHKHTFFRIVLITLFLYGNGSYFAFAKDESEKLLNMGKKLSEDLWMKDSESRNLFEKAAQMGNGEAAFILFCYHSLGMYKGREITDMKYGKTYYDTNFSWDEYFDKGLQYLKLATDLNYPELTDFNLVIEGTDSNDKKTLSERLRLVYDAKAGDPMKQFECALLFKDRLNDDSRYEYWIKKSLDRKDWPLWARIDYAYYLLENGRTDEAYQQVKYIEKKDDYTKDQSAHDFVFDWWHKFYIIDDLLTGNLKKTHEDLENFYGKNTDLKTIPKDSLDDKSEKIILANPYANDKIHHIVYDLNRNPSDVKILYNRASKYEDWSDSITAFNYFKEAAYKGDPKAILKTFNYMSNGYECSSDSVKAILDFIIHKDVKINNNYRGPQRFFLKYGWDDWRINYVLGEFFYNNTEEYRDYDKAFFLFKNCATWEDTPEPVRAESARYLFKCYTNGRGVNVDQKKAQEWLEKANALGNFDSRPIDYLFPPEEEKNQGIQEWLNLSM